MSRRDANDWLRQLLLGLFLGPGLGPRHCLRFDECLISSVFGSGLPVKSIELVLESLWCAPNRVLTQVSALNL